jgi:hypothetical protein
MPPEVGGGGGKHCTSTEILERKHLHVQYVVKIPCIFNKLTVTIFNKFYYYSMYEIMQV